MVWHDLQVLIVKLEQMLHLKVDCSDFGPVRPCSGQGQLTLITVSELEESGSSRPSGLAIPESVKVR